VQRLNGQWAFAIWDAPRRKLFLSRDRFGVRPLYYTQVDGAFLFASEIKALLACPQVACAIDLKGLDQIFTFWVTVPPRTVFLGINQLPPGHSLAIEEGRFRMAPYWSLDLTPAVPNDHPTDERLAEELLALLEDATKIRLRADVPVGVYLSGGIDSTVIAALVRRNSNERIKTFSVTFEADDLDEGRFQREASLFLGTSHHEVRCRHEDIVRAFSDVIWHTEQPILRSAPAPLYLLAKLVRDSGFKVVLTGEGADELFGGYDIFKETKIRQFWGRRPDSSWRPLLLKRLYPYLPNIQRQSLEYLKHFFHVTKQDLNSPFFSHLPRWELTAKLKLFYSASTKAELACDAAVASLLRDLPASYSSLCSSFARAEFLEACYLLPGYILSAQGDRMAMAHAVEGRYPFLDHRLVAFAERLPVGLKMKALDQKYLLKQAVRGLIPESIRTREKQPYRAPDGVSFFAGRKDTYAADLLSIERITRDGIFDPKATVALVNKFRSARETSMKDNMALMGILSTTVLIDRFMRSRLTSNGTTPYERPLFSRSQDRL
jgi:asparagine synthase (glutamine-hydrolysing)